MNKTPQNKIKISEEELKSLRRQIHNCVEFWLKDKPKLREKKLEEIFSGDRYPMKTEIKYTLVINNYKK